jgi:hypothetical protein
MSTLAPHVGRAGARSYGDGWRLDIWSVAIWLAAALIAVFFALVVRDSTVIDGAYLPRGNDSFYHARRILDAAVGSRGFYQFDDRLHAPDGAWIPWPWAYDYLMAKATQVALWIDPTLDPMAFIAYVPVAWIFVNSALFMAATGAIGLTREMRLLAMVCFALSPLTQLLHSIGMVDHHYVEHTFVLLTLWLGLRWLRQPSDAYRALAVGIALGLAPAFHTGLFILQLVPLTSVFVLWLRHGAPSRVSLLSFGAGLLALTQLVLLPSDPYRLGMFEFGLLSWFHFYVAVCTALALAVMAWLPFSPRNLAILAAVCGALLVPLAGQLGSGAGFLAADFSILDQIVEARSPYRLFTDTFGPTETASHYSWLLLLSPALLIYYAYRIFREREPTRLYYAVGVVFGLGLLLVQLRFHYFGLFALVTGGLLLVDELQTRRGWHRGATFVGIFAAIALAYQPALRQRLFVVYAPGADPEYASALTIFRKLETLCAADPGIVLASSDDGNATLFHTECSVIANNFILREADKQHLDEVDRLMRLSPAEIRAERPDVKYAVVRAKDFSVLQGNVARLVANSPIVKELFIDAPPPGYTLIETVHTRIGTAGAEGIYARLYRVEPVDGNGE